VQREAIAAADHAGERDLLVEDLVQAEVVDPGAAVALVDLHREHAHLTRPGEERAGHDAGRFPGGVVRLDLLRDEPADGLAEVPMLRFEERPPHDIARLPIGW
jgi:hypothetical protein